MIVCDTNVLVFDAFGNKPLSAAAKRALEHGAADGALACSDVSVWELADLISKRRIPAFGELRASIAQILDARRVCVLPIDANIAATAAELLGGKTDPFDRLIAATALVHRAPLISADERLHSIPGLKVIW